MLKTVVFIIYFSNVLPLTGGFPIDYEMVCLFSIVKKIIINMSHFLSAYSSSSMENQVTSVHLYFFNASGTLVAFANQNKYAHSLYFFFSLNS